MISINLNNVTHVDDNKYKARTFPKQTTEARRVAVVHLVSGTDVTFVNREAEYFMDRWIDYLNRQDGVDNG